jgi:hypothetical protein
MLRAISRIPLPRRCTRCRCTMPSPDACDLQRNRGIRAAGLQAAPATATKLDPFKNYVIEPLTAAAPERIPAGVLLRELRERGYTDGYTMLKALVASLGPKEAAAAMAAKRPALTFPPATLLRDSGRDGRMVLPIEQKDMDFR